MSNLNIWLIQIGEPLPLKDDVRKMRTALLADALLARGHSVLWWASAFDHFAKDWVFDADAEVTARSGVKIKALKGTGYKKNISFARFIDHRIIARKFRKTAPLLDKPDIIVAASPSYDLAYEAVRFARDRNVPVLVDIRDEWPDIFLRYFPSAGRKIAKLLLFREFFLIKKTMKRASGLIAMMNSLLEWGLVYADRATGMNDRVFYLGSRKFIGVEKRTNAVLSVLKNIQNKFVVTYIGTFGYNNDPSILIECARALRHVDIHFVIAGDGELYDVVRSKVRDSGLRNVSLPGWLDQGEVGALLKHSGVGICPATQDRDAFPNKVFAYLSAGLPIITSYQGELKEAIQKYEIGCWCRPHDAAALSDCITKLYGDKDLHRKLSLNAQGVYRELFDAGKIYLDYAEHIERVAGGGGRLSAADNAAARRLDLN